MKSLYILQDSLTGAYGEPMLFDNDDRARKTIIFALAYNLDIPDYLVDSAILWKIADFDDSDGLPVARSLPSPIIVLRGGESSVQLARDLAVLPSEEASR